MDTYECLSNLLIGLGTKKRINLLFTVLLRSTPSGQAVVIHHVATEVIFQHWHWLLGCHRGSCHWKWTFVNFAWNALHSFRQVQFGAGSTCLLSNYSDYPPSYAWWTVEWVERYPTSMIKRGLLVLIGNYRVSRRYGDRTWQSVLLAIAEWKWTDWLPIWSGNNVAWALSIGLHSDAIDHKLRYFFRALDQKKLLNQNWVYTLLFAHRIKYY